VVGTRARRRCLEVLSQPLRALGSIVAALAAAIVVSGPVIAHSGEWGVFLDGPRSWPGASVHLRGDLPSTGPIQIVLVGADATGLLLSTIDDAPNGHFETIVTFPRDVTPGVWAVEARADGMSPARANVELLPAPPPGPDDQAPQMVSAAAPSGAKSPLAPLPSPSSSAVESDIVPLAAAGLAVAALVILFRRTRRSTAVR
jgi:hypothetical protein